MKNHQSQSRFRVYFLNWILPAIASGILLAISFPPLEIEWVVWFGLVPLLWIIWQHPGRWQVFLAGTLAGWLYYLLVLRPLVSAHLWTGWQADVTYDEAFSRQFLTLNFLWITLSLWCGLFWGVFSLALAELHRRSINRLALFGPPLFILVAEWMRSLTTWNYQWGFLGNATITTESIRQLGSLGGVWLLTWLVLLTNIAVLAAMLNPTRPGRWVVPGFVTALMATAFLWGNWHVDRVQERIENQRSLAVGALQYHKPEYYLSDYTEVGFERDYGELLTQIAQGRGGEIKLLVLPESIALSAISLDGTRTDRMPVDMQFSREDWTRTILGLMDHGDEVISLVMGLSTIEEGTLYNSMLFWSPMGIEHAYHKEALVPFAEYSPALLGKLGLMGESQYTQGKNNRPALIQNVRVGSFICQEVLIPRITRQITRQNAQLLVSGGNDGVFADPAVAQVHARLAQLRAVESGRYIVRAMKTGVTAIISPTGSELERAEGSEPQLITGHIYPLDHKTLFVRYGSWPLILAMAILTLSAPLFRRSNRR